MSTSSVLSKFLKQRRSQSELVEIPESGEALEGRRVSIAGLARGESLNPSAVFVSGAEKALYGVSPSVESRKPSRS